jgi:hypothetical protein
MSTTLPLSNQALRGRAIGELLQRFEVIQAYSSAEESRDYWRSTGVAGGTGS